MRYIVAEHEVSRIDMGVCDEASVDQDELYESDVPAITLCNTLVEVGAAIQRSQRDWAVFEVVGGKARRRAVIFEGNGEIVARLK